MGVIGLKNKNMIREASQVFDKTRNNRKNNTLFKNMNNWFKTNKIIIHERKRNDSLNRTHNLNIK